MAPRDLFTFKYKNITLINKRCKQIKKNIKFKYFLYDLMVDE